MPKPWDWYLVVPILTIAHNADRGQFFFYVFPFDIGLILDFLSFESLNLFEISNQVSEF